MYDMRLQTLNNPLTARAETSAIQIESSSRSGGIEPSLSALQVMHRLLTRLCWQMAPLSTLCNCAFADCAGRCSTLRTPSTCEIRCFLEETKGSSCRKSRPKCHPATSTRGRCHAVDFEGVWDRFCDVVCHKLSGAANTKAGLPE